MIYVLCMNKIQIKKCYPYAKNPFWFSKNNDLSSTSYLKYYEMYTESAPDISDLKDFFLLKFLELNCNKILNIASIQYLINLEELHIHTSDFKDEDMIWLKKLGKLKRLDLHRTKVTDVSSLENLVNLEMLWAPNKHRIFRKINSFEKFMFMEESNFRYIFIKKIGQSRNVVFRK